MFFLKQYPNRKNHLNRKNQVIINRIRIGHTNITHVFLFTKEDRRNCENYLIPLNIKHLVLDYPIYNNRRIKHNITSDLLQNLNGADQHKRLISYLTDMQLYHRI